jgi:hypothetical protein
MRIIELKEIYMMWPLMAFAGKALLVYHNILANNMERSTLQDTNSSGEEITHKKLPLEI